MAEYEQDEFDALAREAGPVGVHRAPRAWWTRLIAPVVVFVLAGALAFLIVLYNWNQGGATTDPEVATSETPAETAEPTESAAPTPTETAAESPTPTPSPSVTEAPEPVIEYGTEVVVRNGAGIQGIAGAQQELLEGDGFTNVAANNISASLIPDGVNTILYSDETLADTAARIGEVLGIDSVQQGTTPGGGAIEVLLASDPSA